MVRSSLCCKHDTLTVIGLAVGGSGKCSIRSLGYSIKLDISLGHLGVLIAVCVNPSDYSISVILVLTGEEIDISSNRKEAVSYNLGAVIVGYSVNVVELNLNVYCKSYNSVICKSVYKVCKFFADLACRSCYVYGSITACAELTVAVIEVKESLFGYTCRNIAVYLLDNLKSLVVIALVLLNLVLDLLFGKTVKLFKSCKVLAVKNILEVNIIENLKEVIKSYVFYKRIDITGILGHCREYLLLKFIRNARGVASLKSSLCKLIGNVDVNLNRSIAGILHGNVVSNDLRNLSNLVMSAAKLERYIEFALAYRRENSESVAKLHFIIFHICNLFKRRKILDKLLNGVNDKYLALILGVTKENVIVNIYVVNEIKKVDKILCTYGCT